MCEGVSWDVIHKRKMNMKKRRNIFICIFIVISVAVFACYLIGKNAGANRVRTSYKEWAKEIGLYTTEHTEIDCQSKENEIEVYVSYKDKDAVEGYKELCGIVNAHNKFVNENPDYFPNDIRISIHNGNGKGKNNFSLRSVFSNKDAFDDGFAYADQLGRAETLKMQYMWINMGRAIVESRENGIDMDIPVLILNYNDQGMPDKEKYIFLNDYKNVEQVIINYGASDHDINEVCEQIQEYVPDAEIYAVEGDHIVKCR